MDFAALKQELADRGFDGILTDTRMGFFINRAIVRLDGANLWPYREATVTGAAPLTITDLGVVDEVIDVSTGFPLTHRSLAEIEGDYGSVTQSGTALFWYVDRSSGSTSVGTFPVTSSTITVQYWRTQAALSGDTDEPLAPEGYHLLIVDMAAIMAYKDSDNFASAQALQADVDRQLSEMTAELMDGYGPVEVPLDGVDC